MLFCQPSAEYRNMNDDKERIVAFLEKLPEHTFKKMMSSLTPGGRDMSEEQGDVLEKVSFHIHSKFSNFDNAKLQKTFEDFKKNFGLFIKYINENFDFVNKLNGCYPHKNTTDENDTDNFSLADKTSKSYNDLINACNKYIRNSKSETQNQPTGNKRYLTKKGKDFYIGVKKVQFSDKSALYYKVFVSIFEQADEEGFVSYTDISKYLKNKFDEPMPTAGDKIYQKIRNAISNSLLRQTKKLHLPKYNINDDRLLEIVKGKGITLNNPTI